MTHIQKLSPSFLFPCFWCYVTLTVLIYLLFNFLLLVFTWSSSVFMFYSFFNQHSLICVFHLQRSFLISHLHHFNQWYGHVYEVHFVLIIFFGILVVLSTFTSFNIFNFVRHSLPVACIHIVIRWRFQTTSSFQSTSSGIHVFLFLHPCLSIFLWIFNVHLLVIIHYLYLSISQVESRY